jgi:hypothetical protein
MPGERAFSHVINAYDEHCAALKIDTWARRRPVVGCCCRLKDERNFARVRLGFVDVHGCVLALDNNSNSRAERDACSRLMRLVHG